MPSKRSKHSKHKQTSFIGFLDHRQAQRESMIASRSSSLVVANTSSSVAKRRTATRTMSLAEFHSLTPTNYFPKDNKMSRKRQKKMKQKNNADDPLSRRLAALAPGIAKRYSSVPAAIQYSPTFMSKKFGHASGKIKTNAIHNESLWQWSFTHHAKERQKERSIHSGSLRASRIRRPFVNHIKQTAPLCLVVPDRHAHIAITNYYCSRQSYRFCTHGNSVGRHGMAVIRRRWGPETGTWRRIVKKVAKSRWLENK